MQPKAGLLQQAEQPPDRQQSLSPYIGRKVAVCISVLEKKMKKESGGWKNIF